MRSESYRDGAGVDKDLKRAAEWYVRSATHGCAQGQNNLALALEHGSGVAEDPVSARKWYEKAAEGGIGEAQLNYAHALAEGLGGPADPQQARIFYQKAADQGVPQAISGLKRLMATGEMSSAEQRKLSEMLNAKVAQKDPHAMLVQGLGLCDASAGVAVDKERGYDLIRQAAELNHVHAQRIYGMLLQNEKLNNREGFKWILRAAEAGDAEVR